MYYDMTGMFNENSLMNYENSSSHPQKSNSLFDAKVE